MATLKIDLQEGFVNDFIVIRVNDREVFRKEKVTTRNQIGYADSFQISVYPGTVNVEINLPSKKLSENITIPISTIIYLGISIIAGRIDCRPSDEPFGYL